MQESLAVSALGVLFKDYTAIQEAFFTAAADFTFILSEPLRQECCDLQLAVSLAGEKVVDTRSEDLTSEDVSEALARLRACDRLKESGFKMKVKGGL